MKANARFSAWVKRRTPSAKTGILQAAPSGSSAYEHIETKEREVVTAEPKRPRKLGIVPISSAVRRSIASMSGPARRPITEHSSP